jgi:hypothetical protein
MLEKPGHPQEIIPMAHDRRIAPLTRRRSRGFRHLQAIGCLAPSGNARGNQVIVVAVGISTIHAVVPARAATTLPAPGGQGARHRGEQRAARRRAADQPSSTASALTRTCARVFSTTRAGGGS